MVDSIPRKHPSSVRRLAFDAHRHGEPPAIAIPLAMLFRKLFKVPAAAGKTIAQRFTEPHSGLITTAKLPYTATHFPTLPHPDFTGKSGNGKWGDLLMQIDSYTGELLDTLDELGIADNTIFIFTADNGPEAVEAGDTTLTVETAVQGSAGPWRGSLFTGFEGALRVPFAIRWPDKIDAGQASNEIVHAMDLFPTLATLTGATVPDDRIIDGIDISEYLLGNDPHSGRDGFVVYMGNDIFGLKWRDWKLHFKEQEAWNSVLNTYTMPRLYNLMSDPQERDNVLFPHTWVPKAALGLLQEHVASLTQNPPIPTGAPDPYTPPKK
jgi:arylsulfatase A-like enzyme